MNLYQFPLSPNCQKVVAVANEVGVQLNSINLDVFRGAAKAPQMLTKNPNGRVPVLEDGDFVLWESNAMLGYIANQAGRADLVPTKPRERADVDRWLAWSNAHFAPAVRKVAFERIVKKLAGLGAPDEAIAKAGTEEFGIVAAVLDRSLAGKSYLCETLTIADFANVTYTALCESAGLSLGRYLNIQAWLERMLARDSLQRTLRDARENQELRFAS